MAVAPYDDEHRTVYALRLIVHLTGCLAVWTGQGSHSFLSATRRLLSASFASVFMCWLFQEYELLSGSDVSFIISFLYKLAEAGVAAIVLLSCFLLLAINQKQAYKLNIVVYISMSLYVIAIFTNNEIKLGYLANASISLSSVYILSDFKGAFNKGSMAANILALLYMEVVLFFLNCIVFVLSFDNTVFGLKAAIYALYIFRITLVHLLVRPYLEQNRAGPDLPLLDYKKKD